MQLNDVKKTIQFAWWSDESAASLPMTFQHADLPVVKSQLMNDVQVMNQRSFTNAFLQVRGCDKEDVSECTRHSPVSMCSHHDSGLVVATDTCMATCLYVRGASRVPFS